ncbi:MAG: thiol reductant ABC exporter subunit CydC [Acidimicrobiales bacterium]
MLARLVRLAGPFRWWLAGACLLAFATMGANVALIAFSAYLIAKAAVVTSTADLAVAITAVRFFAVARAALRYAERYVGHLATFRLLTRLRVWFYRGVEPLAPARLVERHSADVFTRIGADVETLQHFYLRVLVPPVAAALTMVLASGILGSLDWRLGAVLLAFLTLTGVVLPLATRQLSRPVAAATVAERAGLHTATVDAVQGLADLLSAGAEADQRARLRASSRALSHLERRVARVRSTAEGLGALCTGLAAVTVTALAVPLVTDGRLDGVLLAVVPLTAIAAFEAVTPLAAAFADLDRSRAAAERLFELVDAEPAVVDPVAPAAPPTSFDLAVDGLTFSYAADEPPVLDGVHLTVPEGAWAAIVGPSGSGKSTLVALWLRFWDPPAGTMRLGGRDVRDLRADDVRAAFAVVAQHDHLFDTTIADNLRLADPDATDDDIERVCRIAQVHDVVAALPDGYATRLGPDGARLSGGERQRLLIARALLRDAPVLVLDEATAHLDRATEEAVLDGIRRSRTGRTTILVAHHADRLAGVDTVVRLGEAVVPLAAEPA